MKFSEILDPTSLRIEAYDAAHFRINGQIFTHAVMLLPNNVVQPWPSATIERLCKSDLGKADLAALLEAQPQLIVIGTGARQRMPPPSLMAAGIDQGIGIEWMRTGAACRTYNLLAAEGRQVAAGLLLESA